jgi:hypothetical protein
MMDFKGPGFHMQVPTDWFITSSPQVQVMFIAPPSQEKVRPNLMITLRPVEPDVDVQEVARLAKETQEKEYPQYKVLEEGMREKEPIGYSRTYRWHRVDHQVDLVQRQVMFVQEQVLFTLTATRPEMDQAALVDSLLDHMIQTFKFD